MYNQNIMIEGQVNSQQSSNFYSLYKEDATLKQHVQPCRFRDLVRFSNILDRFLMALGCFFALGNGVSLIFYAQPLKDLITAFDPHSNPQQILANLTSAIKAFAINSIFVFVNASLMTVIWNLTSQRQLIRVRNQYFKSLLMQEFAWYDRNVPEEVCSQMYSQTQRAQNSIVQSITGILTALSMAFGGVVFSFSRGWKMAIVMVGFVPVMFLSNYFTSKLAKRWQEEFHKKAASNSGNVIEIVENIKTVKYLGAEDYQINRFSTQLHRNSQLWKAYKRKTSITGSITFFCILFNYALGFWYGAKLVADKTYNSNSGKNYDVGDIISIFFCIYMSNLNISGLSGHFANFYNSRVALAHIINIIDRKPRQSEGTEICISQIQQIQFKNISFQFSQPLFNHLNLTIKKGVIAIVGSSGNGKSTLLNLLMKFYEPFKGQILLRNNNNTQNLKNVQGKSLRNRIGYVGQQPVLLGKTIREVLGNDNLSNQVIWKVLEMCCAEQFVRNIGLDQNYKGLSGGQKQRIAIARAVLRDPEILILDEGTSALDGINQRKILKNLKEKSRIKFIIMIAHRTQTLSQAQTIIKIQKGNAQIIRNDEQLNLLINDQSQQKQQPKQDRHEQEKPEDKAIRNEDEADQPKAKFKWSYFFTLLRLNRSMLKYYLLGIAGAMFLGGIFPCFSYIITRLCSIVTDIQYATTEQQVESLRNKASQISILLIFISISSIFFTIIKGISFVNISEHIGLKTKIYAFDNIVKMEMTEIDRIGKTNLIHVINGNVDSAKNIVSSLIQNMAEHFFTLIVGLSISFIYCWQITLVSLFLIPLSLVGGKLQQTFLSGLTENSDKVHRKTHQIVTQSILYNRTVKSLNLQNYFYQKYQFQQAKGFRKSIKDSIFSGITLGVSQCLISGMLSLIYYLGALFVEHYGVSIVDLFTAIYAIMFSGVQAGCNIGFVGSITSNAYGTARYFNVLNIEEKKLEETFEKREKKNVLVQQLQDESVLDIEGLVKGNVEFKNVSFKYPNRSQYLFKDLSFTVKQKQRVAIVGQSGTGKTTIADLLFKIYRPQEGEVLLDGVSTTFYSRTSLAQHLSIVSQEPALFNRSIQQNIRYNSSATMKEIQEAAKIALAYDFIEKGGFGVDGVKEQNQMKEQVSNWKRLVGSRGSLLSGGQKQRVAISRAIVRRPKVMVFDQATSALDKQTQATLLHNIESNLEMTQIIIAHRLSTIQSCHSIIVMKQGRVVQIGEYNELVRRNGEFARLVNALKDSQQS